MLSKIEVSLKKVDLLRKLDKLHSEGITQLDAFLNNQIEYLDTIEAQNADKNQSLRTILDTISTVISGCPSEGKCQICDSEADCDLHRIRECAFESLIDEPINYHNPADVEALEQAKDSLKWLISISYSHEDDLEQWPSDKTRNEMSNTLEVIDKALNQSDNSISNDSAQNNIKEDKLYPQEMDRLEKENKPISVGDELATVKNENGGGQ